MKRLMAFAVLTLAVGMTYVYVQAQDAEVNFDGDWRGSLKGVSTGGETHNTKIRLVISGKTASQYFMSDNGWAPVEPHQTTVVQERNNYLVAWLNSGGVWSETQVFSLSHRNAEELEVVWIRHVNNVQEGQNNNIWHLNGDGVLTKIN